MTTVLCAHCGQARDPGTRPGWCVVCAPAPQEAAQAAAQVARRYREAVAFARIAERRRRDELDWDAT